MFLNQLNYIHTFSFKFSVAYLNWLDVEVINFLIWCSLIWLAASSFLITFPSYWFQRNVLFYGFDLAAYDLHCWNWQAIILACWTSTIPLHDKTFNQVISNIHTSIDEWLLTLLPLNFMDGLWLIFELTVSGHSLLIVFLINSTFHSLNVMHLRAVVWLNFIWWQELIWGWFI